MSIHKGWREQYRVSREFQGLQPDELCRHLADLLTNLMQFDEGGRSYLDLEGHPAWPRRVVQIEEELALCGLAARAAAVRAEALGKPYSHISRARELWHGIGAPQGSYVAKFGRRSHLVAMMQTGQIRITAASEYETSENAAVRDVETEARMSLRNGTKVAFRLSKEDKWTELRGIQERIRFSRRCEDYYVFCATERFDPRLFDDFDYEACLVILDWPRFANAVGQECLKRLPRWTYRTDRVKYQDPYDLTGPPPPLTRATDVPFQKELRHTYQKEVRIVWTPPVRGISDLRSFLVEIGPLESYCRLLVL